MTTPSKVAMYEGVIALAYADHTLSPQEKQELKVLIAQSQNLTPEQKQHLSITVEAPQNLQTIWPQITDQEDRSNLLNISALIFLKDGKLCKDEEDLYNTFLSKHLSGIDMKTIMNDARLLTEEQSVLRSKGKEVIEKFVATNNLIGRIKGVFS